MTLTELRRDAEAGYSDAEIADRHGVSSRTVLRWRQNNGIPSTWAPLVPPHGTVARYGGTPNRPACRCGPCRAANAAEHRQYAARAAETTARAPEWGARWSAADDAYLLDRTNGTVLQRAIALGRTHNAARLRLHILKEAATTR